MSAPRTLRVVSYNLWNGATGREEALLTVARALDPDLFLLQEVRDEAGARALAEALGMHCLFADSRTPNRHLALLSRLPLHAPRIIARRLPLFRSLPLAMVDAPDGERLLVGSIHLSLLHDLWRRWEVRLLLREVARYRQETPTRYLLLGGDWNSIAAGDRVARAGAPLLHQAVYALQFQHSTHRALRPLAEAGLVDCFRTLHAARDGFTIPPPAPRLRLDYLWANHVLAAHLASCEVVTEAPQVQYVSDHFPLFATFAW